RHGDVYDGQVGTPGPRHLEPFHAVGRLARLEAFVGEQRGEELPVDRPVIEDQDAIHSKTSWRARLKRLPLPNVLWQTISAPKSAASFWLRCRPRPVPSRCRCALRCSCSKARKSLLWSSSLMPLPESVTASSTSGGETRSFLTSTRTKPCS